MRLSIRNQNEVNEDGNGVTYKQTNKQTNKQTYKQTNKQTNIQTDQVKLIVNHFSFFLVIGYIYIIYNNIDTILNRIDLPPRYPIRCLAMSPPVFAAVLAPPAKSEIAWNCFVSRSARHAWASTRAAMASLTPKYWADTTVV